MPKRSSPVSYGLKKTVSNAPSVTKSNKRGPYKKQPRDTGPIPNHDHTYPVGGGSKKCIICGLEPPRI